MRGIITVLNTPFTAKDGLDLSGLRRNVSNAIEAGVAGFLAPALASEVGALTEFERSELIASVVEAAGGDAPVIGGASAPGQTERVRLARRAIELGCSGVLVNMALGDRAAFAGDLMELASLEPGFIMLQDWDPSGPGLPIDFIVELFERVPAFQWLKIEIIPAGPKYTQVLEATGGRLQVAGGWAVMQMIEGLDRGIHAFMPTALHRTYARIYRLYSDGRREEARRLFESALPILAFTNQQLDVSIQFFKRLLHAQGVYATSRVRPPVGDFDVVQERIAAELIGRAMELEGK